MLVLTGPPWSAPGPGTLVAVNETWSSARFLRSRREAVSPADVGLPVGPRRRTPGLRRAELATLAGISVDYLVRLEQGRDRNPSGQVLARARRRAAARRGGPRPSAPPRRRSTPAATLCPATVAPAQRRPPARCGQLLDRLEPAPAFVINRLTDLLAWTSTYDRLVRPVGVLDATGPTMCATRSPTSAPARPTPTGTAVADEQVGNLLATGRPGRRRGPGARRRAVRGRRAGVHRPLGRPAGGAQAHAARSASSTPRSARCGCRSRRCSCPTATISAWSSTCRPTIETAAAFDVLAGAPARQPARRRRVTPGRRGARPLLRRDAQAVAVGRRAGPGRRRA